MPVESQAATEERTRQWLDGAAAAGIPSSSLARNLVYGPDGRPQNVTRVHFGRLRRKLKIFRWLERLEFASFLDVASGWEHYPFLVRQRYGIDAAYYSDLVHRMNLPIDGPAFGKLDHAVTLRLPRLPYRDQAFDVVVCTEVLEHLVRPVESLAELWRITGKYLIVTSLEALSMSRWQRLLSQLRVDVRQPHVERNFFVLDELEALLGPALALENLQYIPNEPVHPFATEHEQDAALARLTDVDALADALCRSIAQPALGPGALGFLLVKARSGAAVRPAAPGGDAALARWLIAQAAREEQAAQDSLVVAAAWAGGLLPFPKEEAAQLEARPVAPALIELLRCPDCRGELLPEGIGLRCPACPQSFAAQYGVPILYPTRDGNEERQRAESLSLLCGDETPRRRRVARSMRRLRRNERPPGPLHQLLWWIDRHRRAPDGRGEH